MVAADFAHNLPLALSAAGWAAMDWLGDLSQLAIPLVLAFGVARLHAAGGALGDLLAELDRRVSHSRLTETLARTLGDPSLQLLFWRPESAGYVDAQGGPAVLPAGEDDRVTRVVSGSGQPLAAIVHDRALADLPRLVGAARAATRLGLENERLQAELEAQLREVRESRQRIVEAADAARRQAERDLHDGAQQRLLSLGLHLDRLESQLRQEGGAAAAVAAEARRQLGTALEELRELARGIHPAILSQAGLAAALPSLAERAPIDVGVAVRCGRCRPSVEMTVYLVASEGLVNVARHAHATRASVCVDQRDGRMLVEIADDGVGGADPERGSGLRGLADRVAAHGGALRVHSPPGGGTRISAELPCE
jgi:signal transduction histidine kinase